MYGLSSGGRSDRVTEGNQRPIERSDFDFNPAEGTL